MAQGMTEQDPLAEYLGHLERLIGDRRTGKTFSEVVRGIINAGSLVCKQIAAHSPVLSAVKEGAQRVTAEMRSRPLRLTYDTHVRREGEGEEVQKDIWLVEVEVVGSTLKLWLLITDWPVEDAESAVRISRMYRRRWAVEDSFKFTKAVLGWEEVQLLDLEGIRTLLVWARVAAGFLYELDITLEWVEVKLLARLGGWVERKDNPPGKIVLTRGLHRLMDMLYTQAFLDQYREEHGALPPRIAAWIGEPPPQEL